MVERTGTQVSDCDAEVLLTLARTTVPMTGNQVRRVAGKATPTQVSEMLSRNEPIVESLRRDAVSLLGPNILFAMERTK